MLQLRQEQLAWLSRRWMARVEGEIVNEINVRFRDHPDSAKAEAFAALPQEDIAHFVNQVMKVGATHGFATPTDFQALVDGCVEFGGTRFLSDAVLRQPGLTASEKVAVMTELCRQGPPPQAPEITS